jgi:hypothetical protein
MPRQPYMAEVKTWTSANGLWSIVWVRYGSTVVPSVFRRRSARPPFDPANTRTPLMFGRLVRSRKNLPDYVLGALLSEAPTDG